MATTNYASVDDYLASQPPTTRAILERVRLTIQKAIPGVEETISYQIPTYKVGGIAAIYFAGWKEHFSVYPATATLVADLAQELAPYTIAKGTIRFELSKPVPVRLISRIAKHRANEVAAKVRANGEAQRPAQPKRSPAKRGKS